MRRKKFMLISVLVFSGWLLGLSQATLLLNTGPGPASGDAWFLDSIHNGVAGRFTSPQAWTIGSVEAWMQLDAGGSATAVIYNNDNGDLPGTKRLSQSFTAVANPIAGWRGPTGLTWHLPAGTYWVGFEVAAPGFQGVMYYPAPSPLGAYAYATIEGPWQSADIPMGFRMQGLQSKSSSAGIEALLLD